jgi:outer membrane protein assembly factor BamB
VDRTEGDRSTVLIGYDARTGRERWHQRAGVVAIGLESGGWAQLTPGVLPVRDVATGERMGVDPRTGKIVWSRGAETDPIRASTRDLLVTSGAGRDGDRISGVDRTTGETRWSYEVDNRRHVQLMAASGASVASFVVDPPAATYEQVPDVGVRIQIPSAATGVLQRDIPLDLTTTQKFQTAGLRLLGPTIVLDAGELVAFDNETGVETWRAPGSLDPTLPAYRSDVLLTQRGAGTGSPVAITALAPTTGRQRWVRDLGPSIYGAARTESAVVVFERDGYRAVDAKSGRRRWEREVEKGVNGVAGMTSRDFYLAGGCPVTSAD